MNKEIFIVLFFFQIFLSIRSKDLFSLKRTKAWLEFRLISTGTAWDPCGEQRWNLTIFKSTLFLKTLIECLCLKYLAHLSKWIVDLGTFSFRENCIFFFQFPFWYILEWYMFDLWTNVWIKKFGLLLFSYFSKRVSLGSNYIFFFHFVRSFINQKR